MMEICPKLIYCNSGRQITKEHFCEIILKSSHWSRRGCPLNVFFISGGHFVQRSGTIVAILVEGHLRNIFCEIVLKSGHWSRRRCHLKFFSSLSSVGHFVQQSETILACF